MKQIPVPPGMAEEAHRLTGREYRPLIHLNNGASAISCLYDAKRESGIVLAQWGEEFVVWNIEPNTSVHKDTQAEVLDFFCTDGLYWKTRKDAQRSFEDRVRRFYRESV